MAAVKTWSYDPAGRLVGTAWQDATDTALFTQTATLDAAGQRTALDDSWGHTTYAYDQAGRLTSAGYPDGSTEADQYDPAGNRTTITSSTVLSGTVTTTNQYDAADELTTSATSGGPSSGATTYSYDGAGNQTGSSGPAGTVTNTFNAQNQLIQVTGPQTNSSYVYDGQGDRLRSEEQYGPSPQVHDDAQDLVGGMSSLAGDGQQDYAYLSPGDGSAPLSGYNLSSTRTTYLATDLLGSVRLATDPTGAVIGAGAYDAWGNYHPYQGQSGLTLLAGLAGHRALRLCRPVLRCRSRHVRHAGTRVTTRRRVSSSARTRTPSTHRCR